MKKIKLIFIKSAHQLLRLYWFIFRPSGRGVKVMILHNKQILLVRHNYGHGHWTIPGGGVKKGELPELAAVREAYEELKISVNQVVSLGQYQTDYEHKQVTVDCFEVMVDKPDFAIDDFEIAEAKWFDPSQLPEKKGPSVDIVLNLYEVSLSRR